jgi:hypothetical protein
MVRDAYDLVYSKELVYVISKEMLSQEREGCFIKAYALS